MSRRAELAARAAALREQGMSQRVISERLGISRSYAYELLDDPKGLKVRARKASYGGTCESCGATTDGSNGKEQAPRFCLSCYPDSEDARATAEMRTKWSRELLIARIREWNDLYGEPPAVADWNPYHATVELHDYERAQRWERANGHWPWVTLVFNRFGSWNAALEAAGFTPRPAHGGGGNSRRKRRIRAAA